MKPNTLLKLAENQYKLVDHCGGFDHNLANPFLDSVAHLPATVTTEFLPDGLREKYPNLHLLFDFQFKEKLLQTLIQYRRHPERSTRNFLCSFNGAEHISRKFLTAALHRFGWYDKAYVSKNFIYTTENLDGHVKDYCTLEQQRFLRKFLIDDKSEIFFETINSFGHVRFDHGNNIYNLEHKLTESFLHVVSESIATSYYPQHTEKFLYSVVTRGLFVAYAPPIWHNQLEKYYGFHKYSKIFDYRFDEIQNPVERLVELMSMIAKFSLLSSDDLRDLYELENDTIEYNYDHYFSGRYLKTLQNNA